MAKCCVLHVVFAFAGTSVQAFVVENMSRFNLN